MLSHRLFFPLCVCLLVLWFVLAYREVENWRNSFTLFRRALQTTEANYMAHAGYATELRVRGDEEEARMHYQRAIEIYPDFPNALFNYGLLEQEAGETELAINLYRSAIRVQPDHVEAHLNLGAVLGGARRWEEAIYAFSMVLELSPRHPSATQNLEVIRSILQGQISQMLGDDPDPSFLLESIRSALER